MNLHHKKMELITYDCGNTFLPNKFNPIKNRRWLPKPHGGLWASPINSKYGWKDWNTQEHFSELSTEFTFSYTGLFLVIDNENDLKGLPEIQMEDAALDEIDMNLHIDFEKIKTMSIDAIHLTVKGEQVTRYITPGLYGWDCESVLILNPACILPKKD